MKKILFLLLTTVSIYAQVGTGQEQEFDYGIKNNSAPIVPTPNYLTTSSATGVYGKIEPINLQISTATQNALDSKQLVFTGIDQAQFLTENDIVIDNTALTLTIATVKNGTAITSNNPVIFYTDGNGIAVRHVKTTSVVFTFTNTTGIWYFYFDSAGNPIASQTAPSDSSTIARVYRIYWNAALAIADKRVIESLEVYKNDATWIDRDWKDTQGAQYSSGFTLTSNVLASGTPAIDGSNAVINLTSGTILDSNLAYTLTNASAGTTKFTQNLGSGLLPATSGKFITITNNASLILDKIPATDFPFLWNATTNTPEYLTQLGVRTGVAANNFFVYYLYAIQDPRRGESIKIKSAEIDFANSSLAEAHSWTQLQTLFPTLRDSKIRVLYKLTFEYKSAFDIGTKKSALRKIEDLRKQRTTSTATVGGIIPASTVSFTAAGNISSTNVQLALEELDSEKQTSLGFTPENVANKATDFTTVNNTLYPTVQAVSNYAVAKVVNTKSTTPIVGGALNARMCVSNGMLYVTEHVNNKIGVFSLANPMSPTKVFDFAVATNPRHVVVSGRNLFVSCNGADKIEVYDIQSPDGALKIGEIPTGSQPKMFELIGDNIFVVCFGTSKVEKYKITMPDSSLSNFSYYKVGDVSVGTNPLGISYNGDGLLAVCGNSDNQIKILSTDDLYVASTASLGGAGHATCAWFNKTQLLVTDWTTESLLSIDFSDLVTPVLTASISVSENPEQIEIVGNKAYIPSLRIGVSPSYLDFIDLSDAKVPVKTKSETLTVNAAGFTAPYTDGVNTYMYVNGHEPPYNIDAVKIDNGDFHRYENIMEDVKYVNRLGAANLTTTTVDEAKKYSNTTNPYTISGVDNVLRLDSGTTTLPNPNSVRDGKIITLSNVSNSANVSVINSFSGVPSLTLYPYESITLQAAKNGATYKWDAIGGGRNLPNIFESTSGDIGIGTTSPNFSAGGRKILDLNGSSQSMLVFSIAGSSSAYLYNASSSLELNAVGAKPIYFSNNGAIRASITSAGSLNIVDLAGTGTRTVVADASGNLSASSANGGTKTITQGTATLSGGTVVVSTAAALTGSIIIVSLNTPGGTLGTAFSSPSASIVNATSFVINSVSTAGTLVTTDTSTVNWQIIN